MTTTDGAFVDGSNVAITGHSGYVQLVASNFYTRLAHADTVKKCGSIAGLICGANQWCDPETVNACGAADLMGTCKDTRRVLLAGLAARLRLRRQDLQQRLRAHHQADPAGAHRRLRQLTLAPSL